MNRVTAPPLEIPVDELGEVDVFDLVFYGVDHSGPSYQARIFLNNPDAGLDTPLDAESGYAGAFTVFGHAGCYGSQGHCDPAQRETDEFDRRPQHPLTPQTKTVTIDPGAWRPLQGASVTVTVVAVDVSGTEPAESDALSFDRVRLLSYDG